MINIEKILKNAKKTGAEYSNLTKSVMVYNYMDGTMGDKIDIVHHECAHAKQFKNIKEMNVSEDDDILEYAKDHLLRLILGEEYYYDSYDKITYEFDANFKGKMETDIIMGKELIEHEYGEFKNNEQYFK